MRLLPLSRPRSALMARAARGRGRPGRRAPGGNAAPTAAAPRPSRPQPPALLELAALYPRLFGEAPLPLKRGIFDDLMAAHPDQFEREALKLALGVHTRSTRYLQAVAAGQPRHDLQGQSVEPMAPEHVHHALWELYRRRQERGGDEWRAKIRTRMARAIDASGLTREDYCARVHIRDTQAQVLLDEALAELAPSTPAKKRCCTPSRPAARPWKPLPTCTAWTRAPQSATCSEHASARRVDLLLKI